MANVESSEATFGILMDVMGAPGSVFPGIIGFCGGPTWVGEQVREIDGGVRGNHCGQICVTMSCDNIMTDFQRILRLFGGRHSSKQSQNGQRNNKYTPQRLT